MYNRLDDATHWSTTTGSVHVHHTSSSHVNVNSQNDRLLGQSKTSNKSVAQLRPRARFPHTNLCRIFITCKGHFSAWIIQQKHFPSRSVTWESTKLLLFTHRFHCLFMGFFTCTSFAHTHFHWLHMFIAMVCLVFFQLLLICGWSARAVRDRF